MTRRFLIVAAVLAAGCEQLKAPKRLKELEDRVAALSSQVETLKGNKPGATLPKADGHHGADEPAHAGSGEGHDGSGSGSGAGPGEDHDGAGSAEAHAGSDEAHAGSDEAHAEPHAGSETQEGSAEAGSAEAHAGSAEPADGDATGSAEHETAAAVDAGTPEPMSKTDKALDDIAKLMASTRNKKPAAVPAASAKKPDKHAASHWGYDGKTGPPLWGSLDPAWRTCEQGKAQSPVDIEPKTGTASPITFHYQATPATIVDNGHTLQVNFARGNSIEIGDITYQLVQLHFHTPSEHTIAGEHFPLEAHLVHRTSSGKLAVVGVLFDAGAASAPLGGLFSAWPRKVGVEAKLGRSFDPGALLPETRTVFRYSGSLTTPPCTEGVMWNVMRRTLTDSRAHLDSFGQHYKINAREVWPLNDRKIE